VRQQLDATEQKEAEQAWQAWLGYYNGQLRKLNMTKEQLVGKSAEYAATLGLPQIPALQKKTIGKMGLQVRCWCDLSVVIVFEF
jgi:ATP-dependent RNA helicase MSS116